MGVQSVRLEESNFDLARLNLLLELLCILLFLFSKCRNLCELLLLEFFFSVNLSLKSQLLLPQSLQQLFGHYDLFVFKLKEFVKVEAEADIVKLGVTKITYTILLFCILAEELLIGAACCTDSEPTLFAEEVTIAHSKDGYHTKRLLTHVAVVLLCSFLSMTGPSIRKSIFFIHLFLIPLKLCCRINKRVVFLAELHRDTQSIVGGATDCHRLSASPVHWNVVEVNLCDPLVKVRVVLILHFI